MRATAGQAVRFGIVGVPNTASYYALYLLLRLLVPYLVAHVLAFLASTCLSFLLNSWFTYRTRPSWRKFALFPLTVLTNLAVTTAGVSVLVELVGLDERVAPLAAAVAAVPVTFLATRLVLTSRRLEGPARAAPPAGARRAAG